MKILVVSEAFKMGGLETQIKTMYENLPKGMEYVFAIGEYTQQVTLDKTKVYDGFNFSYSSTIQQFIDDVEKLIEIIKKEKIDVIHVHPYYSFFPTYMASQITKIPLVYTYHGLGSFNFSKPTVASLLFYYAIEKQCISKIFSVSNYGIKAFEKLGYNQNILLPNPIDCKKFKLRKYVENGIWALFSRIDEDKITEIKKIISEMKIYNIKKIDIYGIGSSIPELEQYIKDNNLNDIVTYKGYAKDVSKTLKHKYNGVIGIGRLLIESLLMGYPTILIGYNKVTGFVNKKIYDDIKDTNFINMEYNDINIQMPTKAEIIDIHHDLKQRCDVNNILNIYKKEIMSNDSVYLKNIETLYDEITKTKDNLGNCYFYKEREIYKLMKKYIGGYTLNPIIDNLITTTDLMYELYDNITINIKEMKGMINSEKN